MTDGGVARLLAECQRLVDRRDVRSHIVRVAWLVLVVIVGQNLLMISPTVRQQAAISFTHQPVAYTELYFVDTRTEAVTEPDGRVHVNVSFAIANRGGLDAPYAYSVRVRARERVLAVSDGTVLVRAGGVNTLRVRVDLPPPGRWNQVDVTLPGRSEYLHDAAPLPWNLDPE